jgi:hypothetical protein
MILIIAAIFPNIVNRLVFVVRHCVLREGRTNGHLRNYLVELLDFP